MCRIFRTLAVALLAFGAPRVVLAQDPVTLLPGTAVEREITDDHPVVGSSNLDRGTAGSAAVGETLPIEVDESGTHRIDLTSDDFDAYLVLRDEEGRVLCEDDDSSPRGSHARLVAWLEAGASYSVDACALNGGRGAYRLELAAGRVDASERAERTALDLARRTELERLRAAWASSPITWLDGHPLDPYGVRMSPDGERAATLGQDGTGWLWNAWTGEPAGCLGLHDRMKAELEFSADGERILILDRPAGRAGLWDGRSAELVAELEVGRQVLVAAVFAPDGSRVATADRAGTLRLFDAASGRPLDLLVEVGDVDELSFSPDGTRLLALARHESARLWDATTGRLVAELTAPAPGVSWARFSPGGERVLGLGAPDTALYWSVEEPGPPTVLHEPDWLFADWGVGVPASLADSWASADAPTEAMMMGHVRPVGRRLFVVRDSAQAGGQAGLHDGATGRHVADLQGVAELPSWILFDPHGERLLTVEASIVRLWDATNGAPVARLVEGGAVWWARFSPNGERLAIGTPELTRGAALHLVDGWTGARVGELRGILCGGLDFSGDRLGIATFNYRGEVWDGADERVELESHVSVPINEAMFRRLLSGDGTQAAPIPRFGGSVEASVWDCATGLPAWRLPLEPMTAEFLPDGRLVVVGSERMATARDIEAVVLDGADGTKQHRVRLDRAGFADVDVEVFASPDGRRLAARGYGNTAGLWDLESGARLARIPDLVELPWVNYVARLIDMSAAGDLLAAATSGGVRVVDTEDGATVAVLPGAAEGLAFSPEGALLATSRGGEIRLWGHAERQVVQTLAGHTDAVYQLSFDATGSRLVSAGRDHTARIWDVGMGATLHVLAGHTGPLNHALFSPDGARVLTTSLDGTARLWNAETGASLVVLEGHTGEVRWAEFSADGRRILTASADATERIWDGRTGRLLATRVVYRDGWLVFEPGGHFAAAGGAADRARVLVQGRPYPLSSYSSVYESPEKVAASLAGEPVPAPSFVPLAPELRIVAPLDTRVQERAFRLEVLVDDTYGIEGVTVEQDGIELDPEWVVERLELATGGRTGRLSCELSVSESASATTIHVRARNVRQILSAVDTVHVRYEAPRRELFVLAMGVADYEDDALDLAYPTKDADDLIARFQAEEGGFYSKVNVQRLADGEVTPGRLRKAREEFLLRAEPEDTILVFAAGHGVRSASGEYYFLTPGTTPDDPYDGIERQVLESLVTWDRLHASRRILLLDTCHSGEAFGEGKRGVALDSFDQAEVDEAAGSGLYIIAASSEAGFAQEMEGNGLFTAALLEGLDGAADANGDGLVGIDELKVFATTAVHERSAGRQRPTAPRIEGGEDFPLARTP